MSEPSDADPVAQSVLADGLDPGRGATTMSATIGLPSVLAGTLAFGLAVIGLAPVAALPPVLLIAIAGAVAAGRSEIRAGSAVRGASFFALAGFWLSYSTLVLGLNHNWFGVNPGDTASAIVMFLASWVAIFTICTIGAVGQPVVCVLALLTFDIALVLLVVGTAADISILFVAAGACLLIMFLMLAYMSLAVSGPPSIRRKLSLGRPAVQQKDSRSIAPRIPEAGTEDQPTTEVAESVSPARDDVDRTEAPASA